MNPRLPRASLVAALAAGFLSVLGTPPARASRGVSIDLGRIEIEQKLTPGGSYRLPVMGVRNPGTERTSYELHASALQVEGREAPPESWFRFSPSRLTLKPGDTRSVKVRIVLPTSADPGEYAALVGPQIVTKGAGAQVGAAAASRITFAVEPASLIQAWWLKLKTFFGDNAPWSWLVPAVALMSLLARRLRSRFALRIERRA
jgi:hypothetical protein